MLCSNTKIVKAILLYFEIKIWPNRLTFLHSLAILAVERFKVFVFAQIITYAMTMNNGIYSFRYFISSLLTQKSV